MMVRVTVELDEDVADLLRRDIFSLTEQRGIVEQVRLALLSAETIPLPIIPEDAYSDTPLTFDPLPQIDAPATLAELAPFVLVVAEREGRRLSASFAAPGETGTTAELVGAVAEALADAV